MKQHIIYALMIILSIFLISIPSSSSLITNTAVSSSTTGIHYLNVENIHAYKAVFNVSGLNDNYTYDVKSGRFWMPQGGNAQ